LRRPTTKRTTDIVQPDTRAGQILSLNDFGPFQTHLLIGKYSHTLCQK
jgi:hypothetical protein